MVRRSFISKEWEIIMKGRVVVVAAHAAVDTARQ